MTDLASTASQERVGCYGLRSSNTLVRVVLVRHGESEGMDPPCFRGRADLQLMPRGVRQGQITRNFIMTLGIATAVYTSPLERCLRTAAILAAPHGLRPRINPDLIDINYGEWQGRNLSVIAELESERFRAWMTSPENAEIPRAESLGIAAGRAPRVLQMLLAQHPSGTVIIVGHESINRLLILSALGLPLSRYQDLEQSPCGVSVIANDGISWKVASLNQTAHLLLLAGIDADFNKRKTGPNRLVSATVRQQS